MLDRRNALSILATAGIGTAVFQRALAATAGDGPVTREMVADAEWVAGIKLSDPQREAVVNAFKLAREDLERVRPIELDNSVLPGFRFAPLASPASLPDAYDRTISLYTFSKSYAMTGLRLGYVAARDATLRDRMKKALFYTASNIASVVQFGGIGALEGSQQCVAVFREELKARRDLFYAGIGEHAAGVFSGQPPVGAFYAFVKINPEWVPPSGSRGESISWAMTEYLISQGRIGCVPGVDFGANGEGYLRFCFARERKELTGALASMSELLAAVRQ